MKTSKLLLTTLAIVSIASVVLIAGCKKDKSVPGNPIVIPIQTKVMDAVPLAGASNFAILAGSKISNVPTSAITGDIGLSPAAGSFITGFGLTEITGTIYTVGGTNPAGSVADATRLTKAKGDLTTAYNDAAGRTSTDTVSYTHLRAH